MLDFCPIFAFLSDARSKATKSNTDSGEHGILWGRKGDHCHGTQIPLTAFEKQIL